MISLLLYLTESLTEDTGDASPPSGGTIGFTVPSFSLGTGGLCYKLIFAVECFFFLSFVLFPKKRLAGLQTQAVIFQGIFIGVDHVLDSSTFGFLEGLLFYIALFAAPVAAILSVNDKFKNLFLCLINAYGTTYLVALVLRMSLIFCAILGIILYFVFLLGIKKFSVLQVVMGKIYTCTLSLIVLVDIWGFCSILKGIHGASGGTTYIIISGLIGLLFLGLVSAMVIIPTYYEVWMYKKLGGTALAGAAPNAEEASAPPPAEEAAS